MKIENSVLRGGAGAIVVAVLLLSLSDALVKLASDRLPLGQLLLIRSLIASVLISGVELWRRRGVLGWSGSRWVWLRSALLTGMWVCYYAALPSISFATAAAALYTAPLMMAVFSAWLLREPLGGRGWGAVAIGLAGVLTVLSPDPVALSSLIGLPFVSAACYALAAIVTRSRCGGESALAMALNLNFSLAMAGGAGLVILVGLDLDASAVDRAPFVLSLWSPVGWSEIGLIVGLAVLMVIIATCVARAYQLAPSPVIGVLDNAYLLFAALWSFLIFSETPGFRGLFGMALIAAAAIMVAAPMGSSKR
ncbi:DMT family transporter [Jiella marina]|uniref:DMT family transporter n=1 Tax=Jiella sp. LLJ827 TaxID=2917712 RepID=UPI002101BC1C|nr:DMT family transporter [Jiella sp. LLJ827]MCQ0989829.1 DMT family transporter [Jiella sp. LLJ827]